ncbi:glycosyltransferase [Mucilaginibacter sp. AW1-3]
MHLKNNEFPNNVYENIDQIIKAAHSESPKAVVLTPSTGSPFLRKAAESVLAQDFENIIHIIVADGAEFEQGTQHSVSKFTREEKCRVVTIPFNTGKNGLNGHRIYAAFPLLINADYIFFLDEDNWWDVSHVSSLITLIEENDLDWAHSMRKIYTHDECYVADDNCESIGMHRPFSGVIKNWSSYVDTNCYAFKRNTLVQVAHFWYHPLRADRYFFHQIARRFPNYSSSKKYTVNYRLKKNGPVSSDYILEGNQFMVNQYNSQLPWI